MLDVHPPHSPTHTWRDFFIHIATIVVGLLIAVGLEQTVEALHRHNERNELREALKQEREENRKAYIVNVALYRVARIYLENDLRIFEYLRQHPGTPEEKLPGVPVWPATYESVTTSAWQNAQQTQLLSLLPRQEHEDDSNFYAMLDKSEDAAYQTALASIQAGNYAMADPNPSHMTPAQVEEQVDAIKKVMLLNWGWAVWLTHVGERYQDVGNGLTRQEISNAEGFVRSPQDQQKLAPASAQTQQAVAAAKAALAEATKTTGLR